MDGSRSAWLSVGIDIGTTSTLLTLNHVFEESNARSVKGDRLFVHSNEVFYQSPAHLTPIAENGYIDAACIENLVRKEFASAGVDAATVVRGTVIITGQSVKRRNANAVLQALTPFAREFVVASAGPQFESELAARGSGAASGSELRGNTICNIDIGGGTAKIAVFRKGQLLAAYCMSVGGRLLRMHDDLTIIEISKDGKAIALETLKRDLHVTPARPVSLRRDEIDELARRAAECLINVACLRKQFKFPQGWLETRLLQDAVPQFEGAIDEFWFSGGVAELMLNQQGEAFGDIGGALAGALVQQLTSLGINYSIPNQPIRATVNGASLVSHFTAGVGDEKQELKCLIPVIQPLSVVVPSVPSTVSSTDEVDEELPAEPVLAAVGAPAEENVRDLTPSQIIPASLPEDPREGWEKVANGLAENIAICLSRKNLVWNEQPVALYLPGLARLSAAEIDDWTRALVALFKRFDAAEPTVVLCTEGTAEIVNKLMSQWTSGHGFIALEADEERVSEFVDIGSPLVERQSVPSALRELVFAR